MCQPLLEIDPKTQKMVLLILKYINLVEKNRLWSKFDITISSLHPKKREVKETRVDRWLSLPPISVSALLLPQALRQANESINVSVYPAMSRVARFHTNSTDRNRFCNCSPLLNHFSSDCPHSWHETERGISVSC